MLPIHNINYKHSIKLKKLIFNEGWLNKIDWYINYVFFSWVAFIFGLNIYKSNNIFSLLLLIPIILAFFILYRNTVQKNLFTITSKLLISEKRQLLVDFAKERYFKNYRNSDSAVILIEPHGFLANYHRSYVFLLDENAFYMCTLKDNYRLNIPSIWNYYWVRQDFIKFVHSRS